MSTEVLKEKEEKIIFKDDLIIINRSSEETPLDIIHRLCEEIYGKEYYDILEINDEERRRIHANSTYHYQIALKFTNFNISDGRRSHYIHGLYILLYLNSEFRLVGRLCGFRDQITKEEIISDYAHSHFPGLLTEYSVSHNFCLGDDDTEIFEAFFDYREQPFNEIAFRRLLITIVGYSAWESESGGPHRRIAHISSAVGTDNIINSSEELLQRCLLSTNNRIEDHLIYELDNIKQISQMSKFIYLFILRNKDNLNYIPSILNGNVIYKNNLTISDIDNYLFRIIQTTNANDFLNRLNLNLNASFICKKVGSSYYKYDPRNIDGLARITSYRNSSRNYITLSTGVVKSEIINDSDNTSERGYITFHPYLSKTLLEYIKSIYIKFKLETNEYSK